MHQLLMAYLNILLTKIIANLHIDLWLLSLKFFAINNIIITKYNKNIYRTLSNTTYGKKIISI